MRPASADPRQALLAAIASLQAQRALLGDTVVDAALVPLQARLASLPAAAAPAAAAEDSPAPAGPEHQAGHLAGHQTERQLRQVSVMFLDIVGSTQLSQHLDPEEIQQVMDGALAAFTAIVRQHGGEVLQYAGDNLLAAFGARAASEDDAERAVHCGLALLAEARQRGEAVQRQHGHAGFNARVGIHTGTVLRGGGVDGDNTLRGIGVNIAARMEQASAPGRLRVSQDTWALVRGLFEAEAQAPIQVKGHDAPIASWLVNSAKARTFRQPTRGIADEETPLVGRAAELALLREALDAIGQQREPHCLTVLADAGLGKSRLLHELQRHIAAQPQRWCVLPARSQPASLLQPYGLLRDLLARRLDIADSDSADAARAKLVQGLAPRLAEPNDPAPELLGQLIGLDFSAHPAVARLGNDARLLRERALAALRLTFERLWAAEGAPLVLLLDDLQWADEASLDALAALLQGARLPLLAVVCARPGLVERRPDWDSALPAHRRITLAPLAPAERTELTRALLHRLGEVPASLAALIEARAEGNPFFAEELVKMLLDQGVIAGEAGRWQFDAARLDTRRLPTTLTGVLQARIDALAGGERRALQMASVIGPVFWDAALGALDGNAPAAVPALQRKAMVQARPTSAFEGTAEESFNHHLLHHVAYETVLKSERRAAHARVAGWLTERVRERSDEYLAITAEHHERAGQPGVAADWFERAAVQAGARHAIKLALQYLDRAEALGTDWPTARRAEALIRRIGYCDFIALREMQALAIERLLALGEHEGNDSWTAQALSQKALLADRLGRAAECEEAARRGLEVAERCDDATRATLCSGNLAWLAIERGELAAARTHVATAMRWAALARERMAAPFDGIYEVQILLIRAHLHRAEHDDEARGAALAEALERARPLRQPRLVCSCLEYLARWTLERADPAAAAEHIEASSRVAAEVGLPLQGAVAVHLRATAQLLRGECMPAAHLGGEAAAALDQIGARHYGGDALDTRAEALWRGGRRSEAAALWAELAKRRAGLGDLKKARAARLRRAEALLLDAAPETTQTTFEALQIVRTEGAALQAADALGDSAFAGAARLAAWRVLRAAGDPGAAAQLRMARAELDAQVYGIRDEAARERVLAVPWNREVLLAEQGRLPVGAGAPE